MNRGASGRERAVFPSPRRGEGRVRGGHRRIAGISKHAYMPVLALFLVLAIGTIAVYAQAGGGYDLTWNTVDAGGATRYTAAAGGYSLSGTAGQPDAARWSGGGYALAGGFWHAAPAGTTPGGAGAVYLPIIVRNASTR
jgi:hypothetical protein